MSAIQQLMATLKPPVYATWNPADKGAGVVLSNGNLTLGLSSNPFMARATVGKTSGKWYWEITVGSATNIGVGIANSSATLNATPGVGDSNAWSYVGADGKIYNNGIGAGSNAAYSSGDVIGVALDMGAGTCQFYKNNTVQGTGVTGLTGTIYPAFGGNTAAVLGTANFGASAMTYTAPSGYAQGLYQ